MNSFANVLVYPVLLDLADFDAVPPPHYLGQEEVAGAGGWVSLCFSFSSYFQFLVKID